MMNKRQSRWIENGAVLFALSLAATLETMSQAMSKPSCDVLLVAQEYIAKHYPSFDVAKFKSVVSEQGSLAEVTYELPTGMLGGVPIIVVDKRTCKVIRALHSQ